METRVGQVETAFTERAQEQVNLLTAITNTSLPCSKETKSTRRLFGDIQQRLTKLETAPRPSLIRANSSTTAEGRQPALIMGGWADGQDTAVTVKLASLQLEIDIAEAFVPGIRRVAYAPRQKNPKATCATPRPGHTKSARSQHGHRCCEPRWASQAPLVSLLTNARKKAQSKVRCESQAPAP